MWRVPVLPIALHLSACSSGVRTTSCYRAESVGYRHEATRDFFVDSEPIAVFVVRRVLIVRCGRRFRRDFSKWFHLLLWPPARIRFRDEGGRIHRCPRQMQMNQQGKR